MKSKTSFWHKMGLKDWFLKKDDEGIDRTPPTLTPNEIYHYILEKFNQSISQLSFANRIVFYHEYIICFNAEDYRDFMENKRGIFGLIIHESVKKFYEILKTHRDQRKVVEPSSTKWVFRFVSHPDYLRGDKGFIGKLLPDTSLTREDNLRVTFIPRQTGIAQTFDINPEVLKGFTFYSDGYYEVPYNDELQQNEEKSSSRGFKGRARLETILPDKAYAGKKLEYIMKDDEITVSGTEVAEGAPAVFRVPSEWVNTPHLRIRYDKKEDRFHIASFGEKTIVNEKEITRSGTDHPYWTELPINSRIVLNGIVGINIFKL